MKTVIKAGLIGRPVSKSLSPAIFKIFAGLTGAEINYEPVDCGRAELSAVITQLRGEGWAGFNVTIPYKRDVAAMLALRDAPCRDTGDRPYTVAGCTADRLWLAHHALAGWRRGSRGPSAP